MARRETWEQKLLARAEGGSAQDDMDSRCVERDEKSRDLSANTLGLRNKFGTQSQNGSKLKTTVTQLKTILPQEHIRSPTHGSPKSNNFQIQEQETQGTEFKASHI